MKRTALYHEHLKAFAKMVDFSGWEMPLHYGSQIEEHHAVRQSAGLFDVSHMGVLDIEGEKSTDFLRLVLANDIRKLKHPGNALYSCLLNEKAGIIDDLIAYWIAPHTYRLIINASRIEADCAWLQKYAGDFGVTLHLHKDLAIIAVQGPKAIACTQNALKLPNQDLLSLKRFHSFFTDGLQIARTGYTGEDGVEIILAENHAAEIWQQLLDAGAKPCGLGARDTLRLEAGYNLYGTDMDESTSPLISNLAWTLSWEDPSRDFIGKKALLAQMEEGIQSKLVGIIMQEAGVLRNHQIIFIDGIAKGEITSGSFSPTLGHAIALARLPIDAETGLTVEKRGKYIPVNLIKLPFILKQRSAPHEPISQ